MPTLTEAEAWEAGLYVAPARTRLRGTSLDPLEYGGKHKGRHSDPNGGYDFPVTVRVDPAIARAHAERDAAIRARTAPKTWQTANGEAERHGLRTTYRGTCTECGSEFTLNRPASQKRRWPALCSDECRRLRRARQNRVRR